MLDWSRESLESLSEPEFFIRWWITFKGPPAIMLDRSTMVGLLLRERGEEPGAPEQEEPKLEMRRVG